jgi:hypothetical protein
LILSFHQVFLAEKKSTKEIFAIKAVDKSIIVEGDDVEITLLERDILALGWECRLAGQCGPAILCSGS